MHWTPMDLRRLENLVLINEDSPSATARKLGRTEDDVVRKASERSLKWSPRWILVEKEMS